MRKRLRQLREERGISQSYIAKKLGFKYSSGYSNIEYGFNRLSYEHALIIAEIFGVNVSDLEETDTKKFEQELHESCNKQSA